MIELRSVTFSYGGEPLLKNCSLRLPRGTHAALMGPSGQGKTTLLRLLLGLEQPQSGSVRRAERMACVFQEPRLLPARTAAENVNAVLSDTPQTLPLARAWLEQVGLAAAADKYPAALSGGMRQRVALARALAFGGDALLLDEPLKGCDAELRARLLALLRRESAGKTLLLVTHDAAEARALADTLYCLRDGAIEVM